MPFDPTTAKPYKSKFDPTTANPISENETSGLNKYLTSADEIGGKVLSKGMEALNVPFELAGEAVRLPRENKPLSDFQAPTIMGGHPSDISEEIARGYTGLGNLITGQGVEKANEAVQTKPNMAQTIISGAMLPMPQVSKYEKTLKALKPNIESVNASEMIAGKLQRSTIENLANPYVNKVAHSPNLAVKTNDLVQDAANSFKKAYESIKEIQNKFYKNAGVTDNLPVNVGDTLVNMKSKISKYAESAIGTEDEKALNEAGKILSDISNKSKNGTLTFGQIKKMKDTLYSIGESNVTELGRHTPIGVLFKQLGHELTQAQKAIPQISKAGDKYKDLLEAEDLMNQATRLDRYTGELNLAKKIKNRYTDIGNEDWRDNIAKAEEIFKNHPESKEFADFGDKIKAAHLALDVEKAKAITPQGLGRIPALKYLANATKIFDPQFQVNMLARGIKSGALSIEGLLSKVKESQLPVGGATITKARALGNILNLEKPINMVRSAAIPSASAMRAYLSSKGDNK